MDKKPINRLIRHISPRQNKSKRILADTYGWIRLLIQHDSILNGCR